MRWFNAIFGAFWSMTDPHNSVMLVIGRGAARRRVHRDHSRQCAAATRRCCGSPGTSFCCRWSSRRSPAALVYLALHYLFVRPMRRITANITAFRADPENPGRALIASRRADEIGTTERELAAMQRDLASMLHQKNRLAALGLAVSKINHDLRNLLASAQLVSDQLLDLPDPKVQRFAPKLMRALERAIAFCQSTLSYGRVQEAAARPQAHRAGNAGRGSARDARPRGRKHDRLDRRDRARRQGRRRSRAAVPRAAQSRPQRHAGADDARAQRSGPRPDPRHRPARRRGGGDRGLRYRAGLAGARRASICSRRCRARPAPAAAGSALPSRPSWCARMAAKSAWSTAPSGRPSASPFRTARSISTRAAGTSGPEGVRVRPSKAQKTLPMGPAGASNAPIRAGFTVSGWLAPVAQLDRAPDYKSGGQEFEISSGAPSTSELLHVVTAQRLHSGASAP